MIVVAISLIFPIANLIISYVGARDLLLVVFVLMGSCVYLSLRESSHLEDRYFLMLIASMSLSLLFSAALVSENLRGYDVHQEFNLFTQVLTSGRWQPEGTSVHNSAYVYNSVVSISILPAILATVSGLDGVSIFKFVFMGIYSMVPLLLYRLYRNMLRPSSAFLAVFLFMSYPTFYWEVLQIGKQEIAELLLVLLFCVMLSRPVTAQRSWGVTILVLTVGLVLSHYSLAYIYILLLIISFASSHILHRTASLSNLMMILVSIIAALSWYAYVANAAALASLTDFFSSVLNGLAYDFLNPSSRPAIVMAALGLSSTPAGFLHFISRLTQYLVVSCLIAGLLVLMFKRTKSMSERKMLPLMVAGLALTIAGAILPFFGGGLNLSRFYHIALLCASPCFVYGIGWVGSALNRVRSRLGSKWNPPISGTRTMAATLLFLYFLFVSGWVWAVTMDRPTSPILDRERMPSYPDVSVRAEYYAEYTTQQDIVGATWLRSHILGAQLVCADYMSQSHVLNSYGDFPRGGQSLSYCVSSSPYIFLTALNTLYGLGNDGIRVWPISDISTGLAVKDSVYSNGVTRIYA